MEGTGILAADIGGTRARFKHLPDAAAPITADALELETRRHPDIGSLLEEALSRLGARAAECSAVFAVAGPVRKGQARLTNLGWRLDEQALQQQFGFRSAHLLNDLAAAAWGLATDPPPPARVLREAAVAADARHAVASVSTGLGLAYWSRTAGRVRVEATEGGHVGFAPSDTWETDLLRALQERHGGHISWERVLCGSGLALLEARIRGGTELAPEEVTRRAAAGDAAALSAARRLSRLVGVFMGDRILAAPISGQIWLMGGVLTGLDACFDREQFLEGLDARGRLSSELTQLPACITHDDFLGLRGACYAARAFSA